MQTISIFSLGKWAQKIFYFFFTAKHENGKKENIYTNCPPYFLHCVYACASCTRLECIMTTLFSLFTRKSALLLTTCLLFLFFYYYYHTTLHRCRCGRRRRRVRRLLLLLLLLFPLISRFSFSRSIFVLTMCTVSAWMCERKLWMFSFVFWPTASVKMDGWLWCVCGARVWVCALYTTTFRMETVSQNGRVSADDMMIYAATAHSLFIFHGGRYTARTQTHAHDVHWMEIRVGQLWIGVSVCVCLIKENVLSWLFHSIHRNRIEFYILHWHRWQHDASLRLHNRNYFSIIENRHWINRVIHRQINNF